MTTRRISRARHRLTFAELPDTFEGLCAVHALRPVRDRVDWANATAMIHALAGHELNRDQADYLEALTQLVGAYEDAQDAKDLAHIAPREALRHLMERHGMSASALGELLGNRSLGSKLLRGQRELSKAHIRTLADYFRVSSELFLER